MHSPQQNSMLLTAFPLSMAIYTDMIYIYIHFSAELIYSAKAMNYEGFHNVVQTSL